MQKYVIPVFLSSVISPRSSLIDAKLVERLNLFIIQYSRGRYEIIGLLKISYSIKQQPCNSVCLKKALEMHQKCLSNVVPLLNKTENRMKKLF